MQRYWEYKNSLTKEKLCMKRSYLDALTVFALTTLTVSLTYFTSFSRPQTFLVLLLVPVTYGFVAYTSREGFTKSSLAALPSLAFVAVGGVTALAAVVVGIGSVLVSIFAGGDRFREYYSTTHLPLLILGLLIGSAVFGLALNDAEFRQTVQNESAQFLGQTGEEIVNQSNIVSSQKKSQISMVEETSNATIFYTQAYVLNETQEDLDRSSLIAVNSAFDKAKEEIPNQMSERIESSGTSVDMSERIEDVVSARLQGKHFFIIIPVLASLAVTLQPIVGLATAVSARSFQYGEEKLL